MPEATTVETKPEDEFAAAFATELAEDDVTHPAAAAVVDPAAAAVEDPAAAAVVDPAAAAVVDPATVVKPVETLDYKAEFEKLQAQITELKAPATVATPAAEIKLPDVPTAETVLTKDELSVLTEYDTEWPDVAKAEALKRKVDIAVVEDRIYREVAVALKSIMGSVAPVVENAQITADAKHYAAIETAHPDFMDVVANIDGWIEKQPKYLQTAMNSVLDTGSAVEVNDLFTRFKQEIGRVTPQVKSDQPLLHNVDAATIQALTPVKGGRTASISTAVDPNDFEGAWKTAATN